ncbi:MAG: twin-arginine translocation signal domain-containing protein [Patescibacteria group bacterium]
MGEKISRRNFLLPDFSTEKSKDKVSQSIEKHMGGNLSNFVFDASSHYLDRKRVLKLFEGRFPRYVLGEFFAGSGAFSDSAKSGTAFIKRVRGIGGSADSKVGHKEVMNELSEVATTYLTDGEVSFSVEQIRTQNDAALFELFIRIVAPSAVMIKELRSMFVKDELSRRDFLKMSAVSLTAVLVSMGIGKADIPKYVSMLEKNPEYLQYYETLIIFRNYVMVQAAWNVLQKVSLSDPGATTLFSIGDGHDLGEHSCSRLFELGPEHTQGKVKDYAKRLVDQFLMSDSQDNLAKTLTFSLFAKYFSVPYQFGIEPEQDHSTEPVEYFESPMLILLKQFASSLEDISQQDQVRMTELLFKVILNISRNYYSLNEYQKPFEAVDVFTHPSIYEDYLNIQLHSRHDLQLDPAVTASYIAPLHIASEISESSFRGYAGYKELRTIGFGEKGGVPIPLFGFSDEWRSETVGRTIFAELPNGRIVRVQYP